MRRISIVRDSTLAAIALGLAVFSTTTTPASALSLSQIGVSKVTEFNQHAPAPTGNGSVAGQQLNKGGEPVKAQLPPPQVAQGPTNPIINHGPWKVLPVGGAQTQQPPANPPIHVCPLNKPCPPLPTPTGTGNANNGNSNGNANGTGSQPSNGNGGTNVTVNLPPVVIGRPAPVYVPQPVVIAQPQMMPRMPQMQQMPTQARPAMPQTQPVAPVQTVAATQPTNCLTKQYLSDGSALFSDVCTGESAMASAAQLQAEAQARQPQAPVPQAQASTN